MVHSTYLQSWEGCHLRTGGNEDILGWYDFRTAVVLCHCHLVLTCDCTMSFKMSHLGGRREGGKDGGERKGGKEGRRREEGMVGGRERGREGYGERSVGYRWREEEDRKEGVDNERREEGGRRDGG